jgi:hypothetical protein
MLLAPHGSLPSLFELSQSDSGAAGATVTAAGSANTMGSWVELIASTSFAANGITIFLNSNTSSSVSTDMLVDIGVGAASSELVRIPSLMAGGAPNWTGVGLLAAYHFNIHIPAGSRIVARCQCATASRTVGVLVGLVGGVKVPGKWVGSRVTAYGANSAASTGTAHTPVGSPTYGSAAQISSSTANPIRQLQFGVDFASDTTGANRRYLSRIGVGASTQWLLQGLPWSETSGEELATGSANQLLAQMDINIPAGSDLRFASLGGTEVRNVIIYGVD